MVSELLSIQQSELDTASAALALIDTPLLLVSNSAIDTGRAFRHSWLETTLAQAQRNLLSAVRSLDAAAAEQRQALLLIAQSFDSADQHASNLL